MPSTRTDATPDPSSDAALRLFLERGYDDVGIREIADAADVSTTKLFKHFPVKEALVFDEDAEPFAIMCVASLASLPLLRWLTSPGRAPRR